MPTPVTGLVLTLCVLATSELARAATQQQQPADRTDALRVFLDCNRCDENYLRTEITFINYVRDRTTAELHVLVTTQGTSGGGTEFTLKFIGLGRFQGVDHQLSSRFAAWKNGLSAAGLTVRRRLGSSERQPESMSATG